MPCRIQDFPFTPQTWTLWLNSETSLLTYKYIKFYRKKQSLKIPDLPNESVLTMFDTHWMLLTSWIYQKRWNQKYKLPQISKETRMALKLEGEMWLKFLELCQALVGYENEDKAFGLWGAAFFEYKIFSLKKFYNTNKYSPIKGNQISRKKKTAENDYKNILTANNGKYSIKQSFQGQLKDLRQGKNPFNSDNRPWFYSIIQNALDVLQKQVGYFSAFKGIWEDFLKQRTEWVKGIEKPGLSFLWAENQEWYFRFPGTKRGQRKIPSIQNEKNVEPLSLAWQEFQELSHSLNYSPKNEQLWIQGKNRTLLDSRQGYVVVLLNSN